MRLFLFIYSLLAIVFFIILAPVAFINVFSFMFNISFLGLITLLLTLLTAAQPVIGWLYVRSAKQKERTASYTMLRKLLNANSIFMVIYGAMMMAGLLFTQTAESLYKQINELAPGQIEQSLIASFLQVVIIFFAFFWLHAASSFLVLHLTKKE